MNVCHVAGCLVELAVVVVRVARYHRPYLNLLWRFVASEAELVAIAHETVVSTVLALLHDLEAWEDELHDGFLVENINGEDRTDVNPFLWL